MPVEFYAHYRKWNPDTNRPHGEIDSDLERTLPPFPEHSAGYILDAFGLVNNLYGCLPSLSRIGLSGFHILVDPEQEASEDEEVPVVYYSPEQCREMAQRLSRYSTRWLYLLVAIAVFKSKVIPSSDGEDVRRALPEVSMSASILSDLKICIVAAAKHGYGISIVVA
jgi:hypothetical protein